MRIGLDFDNTIVCYDQAIAVLAEELFELPKELPRTKLALRDFLRAQERETEWTLFQGELYGPGMSYAQPFDGALETMKRLAAEGHELMIVSHRSRRPYAGTPHDLHGAARNWVDKQLRSVGLFNDKTAVIDFLETREKKLARISELRCNVFIDDLVEVLVAPDFPNGTVGILFDPSALAEVPEQCQRATAWRELSGVLQILG